MSTAHTPGKWTAGSNGHKFWVSGPDETGAERVADCGPDEQGMVGWVPRKEQEANAQLIASAPQLLSQRNALLEALKALVNSAVRHRWHVNSDEPDTIDAAMDAIKEATI